MNYNPFSLQGKRILITGASSGIGQATAIECSKLGASLILTARNEDRLKETISMLDGSEHTYFVADLSDSKDIDEMIEKIPTINGCVNNAGFNKVQLLPFFKDDEINDMLEVNFIAPIKLTHKLVKKRKIEKGSSVVFTSSISKSIVVPGNCMYSATKGGLSSFMKNAALELASKNIRCNAVLPGMVETPLKENKSFITDEQWEANKKLYPLKRFGTPKDIALSIVYLLSDASSWITGSELIIDGGRSLK